jgi:hypothetical protein
MGPLMGDLEDSARGQILALSARCLVGRGSQCSLRIDQQYVSVEHAVIAWNGEAWEVRDLGSRNGTFVDGQQLPAGGRKTLVAGARLGFGLAEPVWVLADDEPPATPRATNAMRTVGLEPQFDLAHLTTRFEVSADEEHVALVLVQGSAELRLLPRAFNYVLLTLARASLDDRKAGGPDGEEGWRYADDLARELGMEVERMNVDIFRARKQLAEARVRGAAALVERRPTTHQLRLGVRRLEVVKSSAKGG